MLPGLKNQYQPDLIIGNVNGATGGNGIGKAHSVYLRKLGIEVMTTGEAAFYKKDIVEAFPRSPWLLRPVNYPPGVPGRGIRTYPTAKGPVTVLQLLGQSGFARVHLDNPFQVLDAMLPRLKAEAAVCIVDFRAPTTAEKNAMFWHADGKVSAIIGSGARTLTADAGISAAGTATITDAGRTGSLVSVGGMDPDMCIKEFRTGVPVWVRDALQTPELQGCVIDFEVSGRACDIKTLRIRCEEDLHEGAGNGDKNPGD
jgi:hypothetical protein